MSKRLWVRDTFTGWMPFLSPDQQCQSAEGITDVACCW